MNTYYVFFDLIKYYFYNNLKQTLYNIIIETNLIKIRMPSSNTANVEQQNTTIA